VEETAVTFAFPPALIIAALVLPLSIALFFWKTRWTRRQLSAVIAPRLRDQLTSSVDWARRRGKAILFVSALIFLLISIARPQYGFEKAEMDRKNVDFTIALDLSRSMLTEDMDKGSRLTEAKNAIGDLLDTLSGGDRVGLIAFAGEAFLAAPITFDHEAVRRNLASLEPRVVTRPGSDLAAAIRLAEKVFSVGEFESKALILVTDGEELQGDAVVAAREAAQRGMRIFTVGVGSLTGARIPERDRTGKIRFVRNEFGNEVVSRLNQRVLQQIAASGSGFYHPIGINDEGLQKVYQSGVLPLGKGTRQKLSSDPGEYFQWPLGLAILLFLVELLVSDRRKPAVPTTR
jgi:Ca-activated chloride channel family protein